MVNITIRILDRRGNEKYITIDTKNTIQDLKIKYGNPNARFTFKGKFLINDKKIEDYHIYNGNTIWSVIESIGGEVGSLKKGFTDPKKVGPIRYSTLADGPHFLIVKEGINLFGICKNKNCIAFKKEVCSPFGFGTFDLINDLEQDNEKCPKCPACEHSLLKLETCGFMNCKFKYVGIKVENGKYVDVNYENSIYEPDKLDYFDGGKDWGNKDMWIQLKISASH